jgi:hypothetical protein
MVFIHMKDFWPGPNSYRCRLFLAGAACRVHCLLARQLFDLSGDLSALAERDLELKITTGRGDEFAHRPPGFARSGRGEGRRHGRSESTHRYVEGEVEKLLLSSESKRGTVRFNMASKRMLAIGFRAAFSTMRAIY